MSRIPSRQVPTSPGALSPDIGHPTHFTRQGTPTAQPLVGHVPQAQTQSQYDMPRAPSSSSTATSVTSGSSGVSAQTVATNTTRPSSFSSSENPHSLEPKLHQQARSEATRPAPVPLQEDAPLPTHFEHDDLGQASGAVQPRTGQSAAGVFVARQQALPHETTSAFGKPRLFNLSQPPRGHRNSPRSSSGRALWGARRSP
ncbi:hypothetical protein OPQ81_010059 [Rhizoctonia solani]|nr:hypothetical protein OPQ81_010059 [Rhizoctonia solani]